MSFILEALRRAERERNAGQTPELRIVSDGSGTHIASNRPPLPWIVGGLAGAFILGGIIIYLVVRPARQPDAPVDVGQPAVAMTPAPAATQENADEFDPSNPKRLDDLVDPEAGLSEQPPAQAQGYSAPQQSQLITPSTARTMQAQAQQMQAQPHIQEQAPAPVEEVPPPQPVQQVQELQLQAAPPPDIRQLKDMPPDYRAAFPQLSLDVHFYDDDPARRFVMINGKRYREGDGLQEGPRVSEITADGVVLSHHGQEVLLPAAH